MSLTQEIQRERKKERLLATLRTRKRKAQQAVKRAERRLERTGEDARGPNGDAELAHAEGRLRGYELAEKIAELV